jgi:hypothetical protein
VQQVERAYQKQAGIFENKKVIAGRAIKGSVRYVKNIGLGFKTPTEVRPLFFSCFGRSKPRKDARFGLGGMEEANGLYVRWSPLARL